MKKRQLLLAASMLLSAIAAGSVAMPQSAPPPANGTSEAPAPYAMTMGDMMNTLIQPRHEKLGLAGHARNWALAEYALAEIRQAFAGIVKAQPRFNGLPVAELVAAAVSQPINAVDAAIKQQNPQQFTAAYAQLTAGCNACHVALDHPFVVIKPPDTSAFPNQDFNPRP